MRAHRSHSQLNSYLKCGWSYYLQKVARKPESPCVWLAAGKAFHSATERYDRQYVTTDDDMTDLELDVWRDVFTDEFERELDDIRAIYPDESTWRRAGRPTKDKPNKEDITWWHTAGREMLVDYIKWREDYADVWELASINGEPAIEVEVIEPLGGIPMKGWIDRVFRSKIDGRLVVVDLKSGSRTPASPMQLATYSVQLEPMLGGEQVLWGAWYDARKGSLGEPINLARWSEPLLGKVYTDLDRGITAGIFLPNIDSHCNNCGVAKFCIFNGGREDAAA